MYTFFEKNIKKSYVVVTFKNKNNLVI